MTECSGCQEVFPLITCDDCGFEYCDMCMGDTKQHTGCQKVIPVTTCNDCGFEYCATCMEDENEHTPCSKHNHNEDKAKIKCDRCGATISRQFACFCKSYEHILCSFCITSLFCRSCSDTRTCTQGPFYWCFKCSSYHCELCVC